MHHPHNYTIKRTSLNGLMAMLLLFGFIAFSKLVVAVPSHPVVNQTTWVTGTAVASGIVNKKRVVKRPLPAYPAAALLQISFCHTLLQKARYTQYIRSAVSATHGTFSYRTQYYPADGADHPVLS